MQKQGSRGGSRKIGRNRAKCERYAAMHTRERNKRRRAARRARRLTATPWYRQAA